MTREDALLVLARLSRCTQDMPPGKMIRIAKRRVNPDVNGGSRALWGDMEAAATTLGYDVATEKPRH